jgi:hypothetical protein
MSASRPSLPSPVVALPGAGGRPNSRGSVLFISPSRPSSTCMDQTVTLIFSFFETPWGTELSGRNSRPGGRRSKVVPAVPLEQIEKHRDEGVRDVPERHLRSFQLSSAVRTTREERDKDARADGHGGPTARKARRANRAGQQHALERQGRYVTSCRLGTHQVTSRCRRKVERELDVRQRGPSGGG